MIISKGGGIVTKLIKKVQAINAAENKDITIDYPACCPKCGCSGVPTIISSAYIKDKCVCPNMFVVFFCHNCEQVFIGNYGAGYDRASQMSLEPMQCVKTRNFSENIQEISPDFCNIYNQAYASQQYGLKDICGISYRKALEFLVKDYAIHLIPDKEEVIKNKPLSGCINDYIDNKRIKKLALASAWIGNDETHYIRKHEEYNVDDLVAFINAIVSFIDSDLSAEKAEKLISSKCNNKN